MSLPSGTCIDPYELLTPLGAGGMGEVYRPHDGRLDRDVAVKALSSLPVDPEWMPEAGVASFSAALGRLEASQDWLENAVDRTHVPVRLFLCDPNLAPIRSLTRFERILARACRIQASVPEEP